VNLGQTDTARTALERALALRAGHALFLYSLAEMEYQAGRISAALAASQLSLRGEPLHPRSWEIAIDSLRRLGDDRSADQLQAEAPP
jgi:Tfp pilus assembly protein PilF